MTHDFDIDTYCFACHTYRHHTPGFYKDDKWWCGVLCYERVMKFEGWANDKA